VDDAIHCYRQALSMRPAMWQAAGNLGVLLEQQGLMAESLQSYQAAVHYSADTPGAAAAQTNFLFAVANWQKQLFTLLRAGNLDPALITAEHRRLARLIEADSSTPGATHANEVDPQRQLRVGYVSPDLRKHSVAHFIEPVLAHHDAAVVDVHCYYNGPPGDQVTDRIRGLSAHWVECASWTDQQLVERIRADAIDILVDLAGHTQGNRFLTFALKPAPVQIAYLGYPSSTELVAMDYRLTDEQAEPAGAPCDSPDRPVALSPRMLVYRPPFGPNGLLGDAEVPVATAPCLERGFVTFGCCIELSKLSGQTITTWARLLAEVSGSVLLLKARGLEDPQQQQEWRARFARYGVAAERLRLMGRDEIELDHLHRYRDVDITLDTYPYNGVTTTCESLWMGVPVISMAGSAVASRMGLSILSAIGERRCIARDADEYVSKAVALAADPIRLNELRQGLRARLEASPLMDAPALTCSIEGAYRDAWRAWCARRASLPVQR
jgi:predicted O-linked N-acetylglucosamine transferase (SPINDLY family)